ncbi:Adaptive-response sensory-kinase SasA (plasmid) [Planktothrix agardhii]|nr:Adaptive-response sensory-kinase SasA [Planktothrix agardhii]
MRDIQADICQTCFTEIIAGWDTNKRFDEWVYTYYNHKDYIRIFTPIILVQDQHGANDKKWFNVFSLKLIKNEVIDSWFELDQRHNLEDNGQHSIVEIILPESYVGYEIKVIGTLELGYEKASKPIEIEQVKNIIKYAGSWALDIRKTQLPCVLEKIAKIGMNVIKADGTSIHFIENAAERPYIHKVSNNGTIKQQILDIPSDSIHYTYEVLSGLIGRDFLRSSPPRRTGLGQEAIIANKPMFVPDVSQGDDSNKLKSYNPNAFSIGIRAMAASPLIVDNQKGALYFHFTNNILFNKRVISLLNLFDNRVENAIWHSITYEHQRDKANQLMALHSITQSLTQTQDEKDLLKYIASNSLNILAADTVSIYRYIQAEDEFPPPPAIAGRLKFSQEAQAEIDESDVPSKIVKYGKNVYSPEEAYQDIFKDSSFAKRENIKSTAGILLKANNQIVGVMFVNYRRPHSFSEDEKTIIETLAYSAAIAIINQQWLEALNCIDRRIKTSVDMKELLTLILQRAVQLTGANLGDIRTFSSLTQELVMEVWYPQNVQKVSTIRTKPGEGITGWVAQNKTSALVNDVTKDPRYITYFEKSGSELCVPLLDKDYLLGVINLERYRTGAFQQRDLQILEALADQAVIAIQNVRNKEQLIEQQVKMRTQQVKMRTLLTMGNLASPLIHQMNSDIGLIRLWAIDILEVLDKGEKPPTEKVSKILTVAEQVLHQTEKMNVWIQNEDQLPINLSQVLKKALKQMGSISTNIIQRNELPENLPNVSAGEQQLIYVFDNLICNAVEAMPEGGTLLISGQTVEGKVGRSVVVSICDTGNGIPKEKFDKIFQAGYTTHRSGKGMGFGLWWTQAYLESLGGDITVNSEQGKGSQFVFTLPVYPSEV